MPAEFKYDPLDNSSREIRLLQILPQSGAVIQCRLQNASLSVEHISLSHRWTEKAGKIEIFVNNKPCKVSNNIWQFLDVARSKYSSSERFWIDAICIDQQSIGEKNKQVRLMGEIYSSAKLVVSWLGKDDINTALCIKAIKNAELNLNVNHFEHVSSPEDIFRRDFWENLARFFELDYWRRAWVVQEVLLAKDAYILHDTVELPWPELISFWNRVRRPDIAPQTHLHRLEGWQFGHEQASRQAVKRGDLAPLRSLLARFGKQSCNDFHDRVYSLLSLAKERDNMLVDYRSSREELFFHTISACGTDKCFCFATHLLNILRLGSSVRNKQEIRGGLWNALRFHGIERDVRPTISFAIDMRDSLRSEADVEYEKSLEARDWVRGLPPIWRKRGALNVRFPYTAVPADFLLLESQINGELFVAAVRFHRGRILTERFEYFRPDQSSGCFVHCQAGTSVPCCLQFTKTALLKLLILGEQHTICHESSFGGYELMGKDGKLECARPIHRYSPQFVRRASVPYRTESIPSTPRSTPRLGSFSFQKSPSSAIQLKDHAQALRRGLGQVNGNKLLHTTMVRR